ncbi:Protein gts1 [Coniosporium tulheliwenetii]|uniref:Protein gts1 n=1 Tax=Coniosporium tulheliwenetii TaxID=3383036 RepID=A0ACC2ZD19_9PEZI|nr:Protein gts1 [Cladosporium sp. JES 115]
MSSALSKRQQARNERTLQDLIKTVPGNDRMGKLEYAPFQLGIFLCMRCAALHRKLGTHVSKVKSLSMDSWNNEQVDTMKRMGNAASNRLFNPQNAKPAIPIDVDEVDGAMERYIRQKYEHQAFKGGAGPGTRHDTGSTSSAEDRPPPLPPKPGKRFGFGLRAASSTFPLSRHEKTARPISPEPAELGMEQSPPRVNKPSRVFGANVANGGIDLDSKLATLREMGFLDEKRNLTVLKGLNGNLDKAVEALIRLGERDKSPSRGQTPAPVPKDTNVNGITIDRTRRAPATGQTNNPFDQLDAPGDQQQQPQANISTQRPMASNTVYSAPTSPTNPYNPFLPLVQPPTISQTPLEQSFQNMQISQQPQQLFPHSTGGYQYHGQQQHNPFLQAFTPPPMPEIPSQYSNHIPQAASYQAEGQYQQFQQQAQMQSSNPFLRTSRSQIFTSTNPFNIQQSTPTSAFAQAPPQPQQQYTAPYPPQPSQPIQTSQQAPAQASYAQPQPPPQFQDPIPHQQQHQQNLAAFHQNHHFPIAQPTNPPQRFDKTSILALYNYPHLAPARPSESTSAIPEDAAAPSQARGHAKQRSVTMPVPATQTSMGATAGAGPVSLNPFASAGGGAGGAGGTNTAFATGSGGGVDFAASMMNGRHSPDAFAGLSSRFVR